MQREWGLSTLCVHGGESRDPQGAMHVPLYNHTTFGFPNTQALLDVIDGRVDGGLYTRYGHNPTIKATERRLALLEGGEAALAFGAGIAAEAAVLLAHCNSGDHIVCVGDIYGGTFELMQTNLASLGIETTFLPGNEIDHLADAITQQTRIVYFETPSNPKMEIVDIAAVTQIAKSLGVLTVVDNTFASPINQLPLQLGADIVVHSATKYLGGHSDLTGGVAVGAENVIDPVRVWRKNLGQIMAPDVAFLLTRSLRTLNVRVRQQNANAQAVAEYLETHPQIVQVNYPGLKSFPGHEIARKQMRGFGGMISFVYDGSAQATTEMVDRLQLFTIAPSLGGVESLVTQPLATTHHDMTPQERHQRGIVDGMVRLSCGLEDAEDLMRDLQAALG